MARFVEFPTTKGVNCGCDPREVASWVPHPRYSPDEPITIVTFKNSQSAVFVTVSPEEVSKRLNSADPREVTIAELRAKLAKYEERMGG